MSHNRTRCIFVPLCDSNGYEIYRNETSFVMENVTTLHGAISVLRNGKHYAVMKQDGALIHNSPRLMDTLLLR